MHAFISCLSVSYPAAAFLDVDFFKPESSAADFFNLQSSSTGSFSLASSDTSPSNPQSPVTNSSDTLSSGIDSSAATMDTWNLSHKYGYSGFTKESSIGP